MTYEACFRLVQDGRTVAQAWGSEESASREIQHYAAIYAQDGPVRVERVPLVKCSLCGELIEEGLEPDGCEHRECPMQEHNR